MLRRLTLVLGGILGLIGFTRADLPDAAVSTELSQLVSQTHEWITGTESATSPAIAPQATARSLDQSSQSDLSTMDGRLTGAKIVSIRIYRGKPQTLASDISDQIREQSDIPFEKRKPLLVDPQRASKANKISEEWSSELLEIGESDVVAVLVYWFADSRTHSLLSGSEPEPYLHLVFIRYTPLSDSTYAIARIVWGPVKVSASPKTPDNRK
ncbi:MAG: hypothetical protein KatS3mg104_0496 [Phycisphaerae bacterium]|nr:MAG: hypothetical protein KatS3mg104_0496 [Phycisphaerae bacterium]